MSQYEMLAPNQLIKLIESKDKALYEKAVDRNVLHLSQKNTNHSLK